jgi:hypothetical protein
MAGGLDTYRAVNVTFEKTRKDETSVRLTGSARLAAATFFLASASAAAQDLSRLVAGFRQERTLGAGEQHIFEVMLEQGGR